MSQSFVRYAAILVAAALVSIANSTAGDRPVGQSPSGSGPLPDLPSPERSIDRMQSIGFAQAGGVLNSAKAESPTFAGIQHPPIKPKRDGKGKVIRNAQNSIVTDEWSGYVITSSQTGQVYGSASGTWQVPGATWGPTTYNPYGYEYHSIWVGIGGGQTLIQLGTDTLVSQNGQVTNDVWYELYPAVGQLIGKPVQTGDIITASLECTANCTPGQTQTWHLTMTDHTLGWTWAQDVNYASPMAAAEWILEVPYYNGVLPLNNYVQANFNSVAANGANPGLSLTQNSYVMETPYGQTSNPSDVVNGDWFGTCYGAGSLTPCTAASFTGGTLTTSTAPTVPTASLSASPGSISAGGSSTLTWDSSNATSCAGSGFSASGTTGSATVYPPATTTYGLTCSGSGGSVSVSTTVNVQTSTGGAKTCHGRKCTM